MDMVTVLSVLERVSSGLDERDILYMLSGSIALTAYTDSRTTNDVDIVIELIEKDVDLLLEIFKEGFYYSKEGIIEEVKRHGMFNIIDKVTGLKIDFIVKKNTQYRILEFSRRKRSRVLGFDTWLVSPEDLVISKLIWIQELYSERQAEDIVNLFKKPDLDRRYILQWCDWLNLKTFNLLKG